MQSKSDAQVEFSDIVWRILFRDQAAAPTAAARAPEGRFNHSGQTAHYSSLTPEGAAVAIRRYVARGDPPRAILPLRITRARAIDLRGRADASVVWQDIRAGGAPSPTRAFSDAARASGAQGLLYASRSRPKLTHFVLFDLSDAVVSAAGPPRPWPHVT